MAKVENTPEVKGLGIVAKIMKVLKLDEEGKVGKFFAKEVKKCVTAIRDLKNNLVAQANVFASDLEKLNDRLEDAKDNVEAAYQAVTIDNVANNETMDRFADSYWSKVTSAEDRVTRIEKEIESAGKVNEASTKEINEQIEKYQTRIDRIQAV